MAKHDAMTEEGLVAATIWEGKLLVEFSDELGESLINLGNEYDEMITTFEHQKPQLQNYEPAEATIEDHKLHARTGSPTPSTSSNKSNKKRGGIKGALVSAGIHLKRKISNRGPTTAQRKSPMIRKREKASVSSLSGETGSDKDGDVFLQQHSEDINSNNSKLHDKNTKTSHPKICNKSPIKRGFRKRGSTPSADHVLIPPVLIDGELKSEFQYLSPRRQVRYVNSGEVKVVRSNSSSNGVVEEKTLRLPRVKKRGQSPLKALYNSTVLLDAEPCDDDNISKRRCST